MLFFLASGVQTGQLGHIPPQIHPESLSSVILCPLFIGRLIYSILSLLGISWMNLRCALCLFVIDKQHISMCQFILG